MTTTVDDYAAMISLVAEESTRLVTTKDAAAALNVSTRTLHRWITAGIVKPSDQTAGGHYRWDVDKVREQVRRHLDEQ